MTFSPSELSTLAARLRALPWSAEPPKRRGWWAVEWANGERGIYKVVRFARRWMANDGMGKWVPCEDYNVRRSAGPLVGDGNRRAEIRELQGRLRAAKKRLYYHTRYGHGASRTRLAAGEAISLAKADIGQLTHFLAESQNDEAEPLRPARKPFDREQ